MSESQFGPYQLLHLLGAGGMGQVFLARHHGEHDIQRLVALKRVLTHLARDEALAQMFLDEVRIAAQLNHGNIVQVTDHGRINGQYFMAMEYVHGENLMEVLLRLREREQQLPLDLLFYIISSVCEGLDYAHGRTGLAGQPLGIVHRDITPHNILLSFQGEVKVADFGVARAAEQTHQTHGGELRGKISYMSPEQAYGRPLDHRSDLFSLGIVIYEALANRNPFKRDHSMATLEAVRAAQVPSLPLVRPDLPLEIIELVNHLLKRTPPERIDSARSVHDHAQRVMRLLNMTVTPFDLSDYLQALFPASRRSETPSPSATDHTAIGRRADELEQRRTLHYLHQRRPTTPPLHNAGRLSAATVVPKPHGGRRLGWWLSVAAVVVIALSTVVWLSGQPHRLASKGATAERLSLVRPRDQTAGTVDTVDTVNTAMPTSAAASPTHAEDNHDQPDHGTATGQATTPSRPATTGPVRITSIPPGATVVVDNQPLRGRTPLKARLPTGSHRVSVELEGHHLWYQRVSVTAQGHTRLVAHLTPLHATVDVRSSHRCVVRADGRSLGTTPLTTQVSAGALTLTCLSDDQGISARRRLRLRPGETRRIVFKFGTLAVNVTPWAVVFVDGNQLGTTPLRAILPAGNHRVRLHNAETRRVRTVTVRVVANRATRISSW